MRHPIFQVDAFATRLFTGNPAAVVSMKACPPDATVQAVAAESSASSMILRMVRAQRPH